MSEEDSEINQKSIIELQNEINDYKKAERAYVVLLFLKEAEIKKLSSYKKSLLSKIDKLCKNQKNSNINDNLYSNQKLLNEFKNLKNILKEKEGLLLSKEEEFSSLQTQNIRKNLTIAGNKLKSIQDINLELYDYVRGNSIENMRYENSLEMSRIEQLMLKIKDSESLQNDYENQIDEACETLSFLKRKTKLNQNVKYDTNKSKNK